MGRWLGAKANQTDLQAVGLSVDGYRTPDKKRERGWLLTYDRPEKHQNLMSVMSETSGETLKPAPDGDFTAGHDAGHQADMNGLNVRLMSGKRPATEPAPGRDLKPPPDMTDVSDIKKPCYSGRTSDGQENAPSGDFSKVSDCGRFCPGDLVAYRGTVAWVRKMWPEPVLVEKFVAGCLTLPIPDRPGETEQVLADGWERVP